MPTLYEEFKKLELDREKEANAPARKRAGESLDLYREYQALQQEEVEPDVDYDLDTTLSNWRPSLERLATGVVESVYKDGEWVVDETIDSIGDVASGVAQQALGVPGFGEDLQRAFDLDPENARLPGLIIDSVDDRYGSWNNIKSTLMEDPAGMLFDASGLLTGGGTGAINAASHLSKGTRLTPVVRHLTKAVEGVARATAAGIGVISDPTTIARQIANVMPAEAIHRFSLHLPEANLGRARTRELTDLAYDLGINTSDFSIAKVKKLLAAEIAKRKAVIAKIDGTIDLKELDPGLPQKRAEIADPLRNPGRRRGKDVEDFDATDEAILNDIFAELGDQLTPAQVQILKSANQAKARKSYDSPVEQTPAEMVAHKVVASNAREALEHRAPDLKDINKRIHDLSELGDVLDPATTAATNANAGVMNFGVRSAATPVTSPQVATLLGMGANVIQAVSGSASMLFKFLRKGNIPWTTAKAVLVNAGRTEREVAQIEQELQRLIAAEESTNVPQ